MKRTILFAGLSLLFAACSNESEQPIVVETPEDGLTSVTVHVNEFQIATEEFSEARQMTRGVEEPWSYKGIGAITLAFYDVNGKEVYQHKQIFEDGNTFSTFGQFKTNLPIGHYTLVALGYLYNSTDKFTLISPTEAAFTSEKPRETFTLAQNVTVSSKEPLDLTVTLKRITARLEIHSTDDVSPSIKYIRTTYSNGGKRFNPSTGYSLDNTGFSQTQSANMDNNKKLFTSSNAFLVTDSLYTTITIEALDSVNKALFTKQIDNVPLKRSAKTTITGPIFTAGTSSAGIKLDTDWLPGYEVTF